MSVERDFHLNNEEDFSFSQFPDSIVIESDTPGERDVRSALPTEGTFNFLDSPKVGDQSLPVLKDRYLHELHHPLLSYTQEQLLFRMGEREQRTQVSINEVRSHPDYDAVVSEFSASDKRLFEDKVAESKHLTDLLVQNHLRLVMKFAQPYHYLPDYYDVIQDGNMGLMTAVERFDTDALVDSSDETSNHIRFSTYASWWIIKRIRSGRQDTGDTIRLPAYVNESMSTGRKIRNTFAMEHGRDMSRDELETALKAKKVGSIAEFVADELENRNLTNVASLDAPLTSEWGNTLGDVIPNAENEAEKILDRCRDDAMKVAIHQVVDQLPPEEALVITLRYGLEDGTIHTKEEIAVAIGMTAATIRNIERKAFRMLRSRHATKLREFTD